MKQLIIYCMKAIGIAVPVGLFAVCWSLYYADSFQFGAECYGSLLLMLLYTLILVLLMKTYGALDVGLLKTSELAYSMSLAFVVNTGILYLVLALGWAQFPSLAPMLVTMLLQIGWSILWSCLAGKIYFSIYKPMKTAVIYRNESDLRKLQEVQKCSQRFEILKYVKNPVEIKQLVEEVKDYDALLVAGVNATLRNGIAKYCIEQGVFGYFTPHVGDVIMAGSKPMRMFSVPITKVSRKGSLSGYLLLKRVCDIVGSIIALVLASPLMLATALAIKCYDGGPVFYKQVRLTRDRREFEILKFRSMCVDAEKNGVACMATDNDARITPVGRIIRVCRVDELPQFFNILAGSMSIVGPRPERPELAEQYEKSISSFGLRLQVKAGLTGYAQVYGRYNTHPYDKLQMDLIYINNMSFVEDLKLVFATIKILFMKESTRGVEEWLASGEIFNDKNATVCERKRA